MTIIDRQISPHSSMSIRTHNEVYCRKEGLKEDTVMHCFHHPYFKFGGSLVNMAIYRSLCRRIGLINFFGQHFLFGVQSMH